MMQKPKHDPGSPNESTRQEGSPAESLHRRLLSWVLGGALAGVLAGVAAAGLEIAVRLLDDRVSIGVLLRHNWFVWRSLGYLLAWVVLGFFIGWVGGQISFVLPSRTRHPPVLAVFWASLLGSIGLMVGVVVSIINNHWRVFDLVAMVLSFLIPGAVYGFVSGWCAHVLERMFSRFARPANTSEPPR